MLHLVTGYAGEAHITSADQGAFNMATFGGGEYVLDRGSKFAATVVSNNLITLADGEALVQGRFVKMIAGTTEEVAIENGSQGMNRNDLICLRYEKDAGTGIETASFVVKKGTETSGTPADPAYTTGDITDGSDLVNETPLYRVTLNGLNIASVTALFSIKKPASESGGMLPQFIIEAESGSAITVVNSDDVTEALEVKTAGNHWVCDIPHYGTWKVTAVLGGRINVVEQAVDVVKQYTINMRKDGIYGISRSLDSNTSIWERTDDAVGFTFSASVGSTAGSSSFDNIYPWSEIQRVTKNGDVLVKIPKFWFKRYVENNVEYIKIAGQATTGFTLHPAFQRGTKTYNNIYVGAYANAEGYVSQTGLAPLTTVSRPAARTNIRARGANYYLWDLAAHSAITMLMLVETADYDTQATIGRGYADLSGLGAIANNGSCDSVAKLTGRPDGIDGKVGVVWRGLENLWGNVRQWIDGINSFATDQSIYVCNLPNNFADDTATNYTKLSYNSIDVTTGAVASRYITKEGYDSNNPAYMIPIEGSSSSGSPSCIPDLFAGISNPDSNDWRFAMVGGAANAGNGVGMFWIGLIGATSASISNVTSRLLYLNENE